MYLLYWRCKQNGRIVETNNTVSIQYCWDLDHATTSLAVGFLLACCSPCCCCCSSSSSSHPPTCAHACYCCCCVTITTLLPLLYWENSGLVETNNNNNNSKHIELWDLDHNSIDTGFLRHRACSPCCCSPPACAHASYCCSLTTPTLLP